MAFHYSPKIVTDGLVMYLDAANTKSYVSTSTSWNDISRGGSIGKLVNGPTYNSAYGGSIVFDGVDDYVQMDTESNLNVSTITVSTWVNPNFTSMVSYANIVNKLTGNSENGWSLERSVNTTNVSWWVGDRTVSTSPWSTNNLTTSLDDNRWQQIIGTYDGALLKLYKNGALVNQRNSTMGILTGTSAALVGKHGTLNYYWKNGIAQVQIYNRALSATEVLQNYNATKSRFGLL